MARSIVSQSEQYGLPERGTRTLPPASEVSDLLAGPRIMPGLMKRTSGNAEQYTDDDGTLHVLMGDESAHEEEERRRQQQEEKPLTLREKRIQELKWAAEHSKDDLSWQEQAKPHYVYRQEGDPGYQPRDPEDIYAEDAARNGGYDWRDPGESSRHQNRSARSVVESGMAKQSSGGDWVHAHELNPGDLVSWTRGSGRGPGDHQRNRVDKVHRFDGPSGLGTNIHFADGAQHMSWDDNSQPGFYRHNFDQE